jgi:hypothetical protein
MITSELLEQLYDKELDSLVVRDFELFKEFLIDSRFVYFWEEIAWRVEIENNITCLMPGWFDVEFPGRSPNILFPIDFLEIGT